MTRMAAVACEVFRRELSAAAEKSPNAVELHWLPQGLHDTPDELRRRLTETLAEIERADAQAPPDGRLDAIVLCYGLCGGGLAGVRAGRLPLVLPRTDDCIGVLLGSQRRYLDYFHSRGGIYWYTPGWLDFAKTPSRTWYDAKLREYAERYGADNAAWLLEQENAWISAYDTCIYIDPPACPSPAHARRAREAAVEYGWRFEAVPGGAGLLDALLAGAWDETRFLLCPPGRAVAPSWREDIVKAE